MNKEAIKIMLAFTEEVKKLKERDNGCYNLNCVECPFNGVRGDCRWSLSWQNLDKGITLLKKALNKVEVCPTCGKVLGE